MSNPNGKIVDGRFFIHNDWYPGSLPPNIRLDDFAYPESSFSFSGFHSEEPEGFILGFASGNYAFGNFYVGKSGKVTIGKYVILNSVNIICTGSIKIGDHCMFAWGSVITDSWLHDATLRPAIRKSILYNLAHTSTRLLQCDKFSLPVMIEDNVWVGFDAVILPGVRLGQGCIVGSKTVVSENVPPYAVVAGNPARIIKYLEPTDTKGARQKAIEKYTVR